MIQLITIYKDLYTYIIHTSNELPDDWGLIIGIEVRNVNFTIAI